MAGWGGLGVDLTGRILAHLPCLAHRAASGAVCDNWRAAAAHHPPPPQLPWLLLPSAAEEEPEFFCILCEYTHRAFLPDDVRTARICGSYSDGWLFLALQPQGSGFAFHNLHTGQRLGVPDLRVEGTDGINMVLGAVLPPAPTEDGACLAVVLASCAFPIAFWFPGMAYLSPPMPPPEPHERASLCQMLPRGKIADVIYYEGHGLEGFHVLTDTEEVLVYDPRLGPDGALATRLVTYRFPDHEVNAKPGCTVSRYLVDLFGELVMVARFVTRGEECTILIRAYVLRMGQQAGSHGDRQAYWDGAWFCDDVVVMLGRCSSMAFVVSPAVGLEGLYFLDDAKSFDDVMGALRFGQLFPCTDMGRCTLHHQQETVQQYLYPHFPTRPPSEFSPAVWFFH